MFQYNLMINLLKKTINSLLKRFGYSVIRTSLKYNKKNGEGGGYNKNDLNLNIGSAGTNYPFFINLDMVSEHYKSRQKNHKFIPYDLSKDKLPFKNDTVTNIFCCHVIEHCVDEAVKKLFTECIRVLKKTGVFRISCPDSKFLFEVSSFDNEYWHRSKSQGNWAGQNPDLVGRYDFLISDISAKKLRFNTPEYREILSKIKSMKYKEAMDFLTRDNKADINNPGNHINFFDYEKIEKMLKDSCLDLNITNYKVINSKIHGSVSKLMSEDCFDATEENRQSPRSVYVEFVKL